MSDAAEQPEQALERRIAAYLGKHPDFFERHLDVLEQLRIPHPCRPAVSLLERQLARLREQNAGSARAFAGAAPGGAGQ